jgi:uridylate kinase
MQRVLLKISGESLTSDGYRGLKRGPVEAIIREVGSVLGSWQVALVLGGGNIYRGSHLMRDLDLDFEDRIEADWAGMLATHINGIMLKCLMMKAGIEARLMLAKPYGDVGEPFYKDVADSHLNKGRVVILVGGTGSPRFTTDTGAVLRACEVRASLVLKGTKVDGIYTVDPKNPPPGVTPERIPYMSYDDFVLAKPGILDVNAGELARDNNLSIRIFDIFAQGALSEVLQGNEDRYSEIGPVARKRVVACGPHEPAGLTDEEIGEMLGDAFEL